NGASIFWLLGHAGSGKSALAHTIAKQFHERNCLGSSFFFDASNAVTRRAEDLFSTIARNLAGLIPSYREALVDVIEKSADLSSTLSVRRQFEELILNPAHKAKYEGNILIVVDALDECGYNALREYREFLRILSPGPSEQPSLSELPPNFHFLLTSRPETDLEVAFTPSFGAQRCELWTIPDEEVEQDLRTYYRHRFEDFTVVPDLLHRFDSLLPNRDCIGTLTTKSECLFQWAFTTCEFLFQDDPVEDIVERFQSILESSQLKGLEDLYTKILEKVAGGKDSSRLPRFRAVLGRVLCVKEPLSVPDLIALRGLKEDATTTEFFVKRMGSVLSGVLSNSVIQVFHTSFRDFLFRPALRNETKRDETGNIYYINPVEQDAVLAEACLRVLNEQLAFNLCELKSSYTAHNSELVAQCKASLRSQGLGHLIYASIYWSDHLTKTAYNEELSSLLHTFVDCQFLYWLELLGAIGGIYVAVGAIRGMTEWATGNDDHLAEFGKDAGKFVSNFADVIARSPPHLYISALPLAPESSLVSQQYLPRFSHIIDVRSGKQKLWSPVDLVFGDRGDFQTKEVLSIAYSPDGTVLIAVTYNGLVWLWNPSTGQSIASFSETEASPACIVEISPDGRYFAVGSQRGDIVLRDFKTQALIWGPKSVGTQHIVCLRFSPNSETVWAGDKGGCLGAWEVRTGNNVVSVEELHSDDGRCLVISIDTTRLACAPIRQSLVLFHRDGGDTTWSDRRQITTFTDKVWALGFFPDGQGLVSGHDSGAVKIWDVESGDLLVDHSTAHTNQIYSLAFSSDGSFFVSSSFDQKIQLWDGSSGNPIGNGLSGFGEIHRSSAISADGKSVATAIGDGGIYLWDVAGMKESALLAAKSGTHGPYPSVIALSPDGKHLYAARSDHSICEYDTETGAEIGIVMRGHRSRIWHLSVSSDGTHLVSSSTDTTISIWDIPAQIQTHKSLTGHAREVGCATFSPNGTRLLSCSADTTLWIWDTATWEMIGAPLRGHNGIVTCAVFFEAGQRIISGSLDRTIRIWDAENRNQTGESLKLHTGGVTAMALTPQNNIIASADNTGVVHLWYPTSATSSLQRHHTIKHGTSRINSVSFSADGARLLCASSDHTICLWDVRTGKLIGRPFEGHSSLVQRVLFLHEERIISSSDDGTIRIWNI
ncbi:WD40 repeat-like protein, partial [Sistotremastrum niveocremeum HHB9708]